MSCAYLPLTQSFRLLILLKQKPSNERVKETQQNTHDIVTLSLILFKWCCGFLAFVCHYYLTNALSYRLVHFCVFCTNESSADAYSPIACFWSLFEHFICNWFWLSVYKGRIQFQTNKQQRRTLRILDA